MLRLHPRESLVDQASGEFSEHWYALAAKYDLTYGEMVGLLTGKLADLSRSMVRAERHPADPGRPGDLEDA